MHLILLFELHSTRSVYIALINKSKATQIVQGVPQKADAIEYNYC